MGPMMIFRKFSGAGVFRGWTEVRTYDDVVARLRERKVEAAAPLLARAREE